MPANIPIDDARVRDELTRYLSDQWKPIIESDVDGPSALPVRIDSEVPNLGRFSATRRVARTVYLGSAPLAGSANKGIEDRRIRLGCAMPAESTAVFGDALRRLAATATYLYQDGSRYWYGTQPTVTKLADDRTEQIRREADKVDEEIERRLRGNLRQSSDFVAIHTLPQTSADVPDTRDVRLVVLGPDYPHTKDVISKASTAAAEFLQTRGNSPRLFQNTLLFLAPDESRLQDLTDAICRYLAWKSIVAEHEVLNLDPHQTTQAENQLRTADSVVAARLPETYQWLLVPQQAKPSEKVSWDITRLTGQDGLAERASKKARAQEQLYVRLAGSMLRREMDKIPLWRGTHVSIAQLVEDFARYLYLPRLAGPRILLESIQDGLSLLLWRDESFAYADSFDETRNRYTGLRGGQRVEGIEEDAQGLLVKSTPATQQMEAEAPTPPGPELPKDQIGDDTSENTDGSTILVKAGLRRFYGTVELDASRVGRDASRIAEEVISHLTGLIGSKVSVRLEIDAELDGDASDSLIRTVTENAEALKFSSHGFEKN